MVWFTISLRCTVGCFVGRVGGLVVFLRSRWLHEEVVEAVHASFLSVYTHVYDGCTVVVGADAENSMSTPIICSIGGVNTARIV